MKRVNKAASILNPETDVKNVVSISGWLSATRLHIMPVAAAVTMVNAALTATGASTLSKCCVRLPTMPAAAERHTVIATACTMYRRAYEEFVLIFSLPPQHIR